jgi:hypothetical protein
MRIHILFLYLEYKRNGTPHDEHEFIDRMSVSIEQQFKRLARSNDEISIEPMCLIIAGPWREVGEV